MSIINLKAVLKAKARSNAQVLAAENRTRHGRTKAQKQADVQSQAKLDLQLDQAKRNTPPES